MKRAISTRWLAYLNQGYSQFSHEFGNILCTIKVKVLMLIEWLYQISSPSPQVMLIDEAQNGHDVLSMWSNLL